MFFDQRLVYLSVLLLSITCHSVSGATYTNFMKAGTWQTAASVFECSLAQPLPRYGDAVFQTRAGESSKFQLNAQSSRFKSGKALLVSRSPVWSEQPVKQNLGYVDITQGLQPVNLDTDWAEQLINELYKGYELEITRRPWFKSNESSQVEITSIGFRSAYQDYLDCLADLLPANFDQVKRTSVHFGHNSSERIPESELSKLDNAVLYMQADSSIKELYIDGHTDSVGSRAENLILAQQRAEEVTKYLVNKGVPEEYIISRWHGERYPAVPNTNKKGRAQNRRVTIRLERVEQGLSSVADSSGQ